MAKRADRYLVCLVATSGWLMLMTGCQTAMMPAPAGALSTTTTDLTAFLQQFAREALAAFLF